MNKEEEEKAPVLCSEGQSSKENLESVEHSSDGIMDGDAYCEVAEVIVVTTGQSPEI